jgi:hypothetical protein
VQPSNAALQAEVEKLKDKVSKLEHQLKDTVSKDEHQLLKHQHEVLEHQHEILARSYEHLLRQIRVGSDALVVAQLRFAGLLGEKAIQAAYHRQMREIHPDVGGSHTAAQTLNKAYDALLRFMQ